MAFRHLADYDNGSMVVFMARDDGAVVLGDPPAFGSAGAWPPLESQPVVIASAVFQANLYPGGRRTREYRDAVAHSSSLNPLLARVIWQSASLISSPSEEFPLTVLSLMGMKPKDTSEFRQVVYSQAWRRDDPIVQLPPGATHKQSYSITSGISEAETSRLARSLGLKIGKTGALTAELSNKFGIATTINEQRTVTNTVTLSNSGGQAYRRYARWLVRHEITVHQLEAPENQDGPEILKGTVDSSRRNLLCKVNFMAPGAAILTYCEVQK
jgi:hypothetical protein